MLFFLWNYIKEHWYCNDLCTSFYFILMLLREKQALFIICVCTACMSSRYSHNIKDDRLICIDIVRNKTIDFIENNISSLWLSIWKICFKVKLKVGVFDINFFNGDGRSFSVCTITPCNLMTNKSANLVMVGWSQKYS